MQLRTPFPDGLLFTTLLAGVCCGGCGWVQLLFEYLIDNMGQQVDIDCLGKCAQFGFWWAYLIPTQYIFGVDSLNIVHSLILILDRRHIQPKPTHKIIEFYVTVILAIHQYILPVYEQSTHSMLEIAVC